MANAVDYSTLEQSGTPAFTADKPLARTKWLPIIVALSLALLGTLMFGTTHQHHNSLPTSFLSRASVLGTTTAAVQVPSALGTSREVPRAPMHFSGPGPLSSFGGEFVLAGTLFYPSTVRVAASVHGSSSASVHEFSSPTTVDLNRPSDVIAPSMDQGHVSTTSIQSSFWLLCGWLVLAAWLGARAFVHQNWLSQQPLHKEVSSQRIAMGAIIGGEKDAEAIDPEATGDQLPSKPTDVESTEAEPVAEIVVEKKEATEIVEFVIPAMAIGAINPLMTVIDNAFVGLGSSVQVAAMGPSQLLLDFPGLVFWFPAVATTQLVATNLAKSIKEEEAVQDVLRVTLPLSLVVGTLLLFAIAAGKNLALTSLGTNTQTHPWAIAYVSIRMLWYPLMLVNASMQSALLATKDVVTPLKVVATAGLVNGVLDYLLCRVFDMGIVGAALGTIAAQACTIILMVLSIRQKNFWPKGVLNPRNWPWSWKQLQPFLAFAPPIAMSTGLRVIGYSMLTTGAASFGVAPLAAHQIIVGIFIFLLLLGDPLNQVVQIMLPKYLFGAKRSPSAAKALTSRLMGAAFFIGALSALAAVLTIQHGAFLFTSDLVVTEFMQSILVPVVFGLLFSPPAIVLDAILLSTRDFKTLIGGSMASVAALSVALKNLTSASMGLCGVWWALFTMFAVRNLVGMGRIIVSKTLERPLKVDDDEVIEVAPTEPQPV